MVFSRDGRSALRGGGVFPAQPRETPLRPRLARPAKIKCAVTGKNKGHTFESFQFRNPSWNKMTTLNIDYDYINDHDYEC